METILIFCQEILQRPINDFDRKDVSNWFEKYESKSLRSCIVNILMRCKNKDLKVYSTKYISNYLKKNCVKNAFHSPN